MIGGESLCMIVATLACARNSLGLCGTRRNVHSGLPFPF
jgi:hypothetical protein